MNTLTLALADDPFTLFGRVFVVLHELADVVEYVVVVMVSNPFLLALLAGSLLTLGIRIFRKVKGAAK